MEWIGIVLCWSGSFLERRWFQGSQDSRSSWNKTSSVPLGRTGSHLMKYEINNHQNHQDQPFDFLEFLSLIIIIYDNICILQMHYIKHHKTTRRSGFPADYTPELWWPRRMADDFLRRCAEQVTLSDLKLGKTGEEWANGGVNRGKPFNMPWCLCCLQDIWNWTGSRD